MKMPPKNTIQAFPPQDDLRKNAIATPWTKRFAPTCGAGTCRRA